MEDDSRLSGKGSLPPIYSTPIMLPTTDFATLRIVWMCVVLVYIILCIDIMYDKDFLNSIAFFFVFTLFDVN